MVDSWTDDETNYAVKMKLAGYTCAQIGQEIGKTRGAVSGKLDRLNVKNSNTKTLTEPSIKTKPIPPQKKIKHSKNISYNSIKDSVCRWPTNKWDEGNADIAKFCGIDSGDNVYCERHFKLSGRSVKEYKLMKSKANKIKPFDIHDDDPPVEDEVIPIDKTISDNGIILEE